MSSFSPERSALRGIGASLVVAEHSLQYAFPVALGGLAGTVLLGGVEDFGWAGVCLFLTLSIYLLMGRLDEGLAIGRYFRSRIRRIWPTYFGYCFLVILLFHVGVVSSVLNLDFVATLLPAASFPTLLSPYVPIGLGWTVQLEELAYLCFPAIALLGSRGRTVVGGLAIGVSLAASGLWYSAPNWAPAYTEPWTWLACYGAGLLAYQRGQRPLPTWFKRGAIGLAAVPFLSGAWWWLGWPLGVLLIAPLAAVLVAEPPRQLRRLTLVMAGECSYALYLVHVFWLYWLGLFGIPWAYLSAWAVENLQRHREISRRLSVVRGTAWRSLQGLAEHGGEGS